MEKQKQQAKHQTNRRKRRIIIASICLVFLSAITVFLIFALQTDFHTGSFPSTREVAYKTDYAPDYGDICFGNFFYCDHINGETTDQVNTGELGEHKLSVTFSHADRSITLSQTVFVKDLTPPVISISDEPIAICDNDKIPTFDFSAIDDYDGDITDKTNLSLSSHNLKIRSTDSSGNKSTKLVRTIPKDSTPPVITLNGAAEYNSPLYTPYNDAGAVAKDNCDDEVEVKTEGSVDVSRLGDYTITYSATDKAGNQAIATRTVKVVKTVPQPTGNVIYLTFDDGPSEHTDRLLEVLKKHDVKATFFVTGYGSDSSILHAFQDGHSIGLHTSSHTYSKIYRSEEAFYDDLYSVQNRVKRITGYTSTLMRFPGGSSNTVSRSYDGGTRIMSKLIRSVVQKGFTYFDWNVSSGDAGGAKTADQVYNNVVSTLKKGNSIVLQHDTQGFSVDAVERIIEYSKANGYTFARLEPGYWGAHHVVSN